MAWKERRGPLPSARSGWSPRWPSSASTCARSLCDKLLSLASPLHLYAEELDAVSGQHLGNYPQAFTHLALIDAVTQLIELEATESAPGPGGAG